MYCMKCGTKLNDNSKFCGSCGTPVDKIIGNPVEPQAQQNSVPLEEVYKQAPPRMPATPQNQNPSYYVPGLQQQAPSNQQTNTTVKIKKNNSLRNLMICFFSLLFIAIVGIAAFFILFKDDTKDTQSVEDDIKIFDDSDEKDTTSGKDTTADIDTSPTTLPTEAPTPEPTEAPTPEPTEIPAQKQVKHDYMVYLEDVTWTEAADYCASLGGHLVTITSQEEQEKVEELIDTSAMKVVLLGANDFTAEGSYEWTNGEEFTYSRWLLGEPNNENDVEHYLYLYYVDDIWQWNDAPNDVIEYYAGKIAFICEWEIEEE